MELPVDVALGKVDYMEILGFSDHRSTARVWYQLLNLGYRIPAAGGTDAMANYSSLRGPVGMNRVYARVPDGEVTPEKWLAALKAGRSFATNGPLLGFTLGGAQIGDELQFNAAQPRVQFSVRLRSIVPWTIWNWCATDGWCEASRRAKRSITANSRAASPSRRAAGAWCALPPTQAVTRCWIPMYMRRRVRST